MKLPAWDDRDLKAGTMIRGALWLVQVIGEGQTFTKEQIRSAFPGIAQADRRIRDLRDYGWVMLTNTEDATLTAEDQRFVRAGVAVWDPAARRAAMPQKAVSNKEKQAVMRRDHFMCTICGISGGESYHDDSNQTAVLSVIRRKTILPGSAEQVLLVTECKRCHSGSDGAAARADEVLEEIRQLDMGEQRRLLRWMERDRRGTTPLERAWNSYRRLPADAREDLRSALRN
ncbi:hypothetical protein ACPCI1_24330 [Streptomyces seoulensis]|uniref:hypothetical protein n=1 Tax=Streptomyces seoulensis TaxID=73044 RepID=UPI003C2D84BD